MVQDLFWKKLGHTAIGNSVTYWFIIIGFELWFIIILFIHVSNCWHSVTEGDSVWQIKDEKFQREDKREDHFLHYYLKSIYSFQRALGESKCWVSQQWNSVLWDSKALLLWKKSFLRIWRRCDSHSEYSYASKLN